MNLVARLVAVCLSMLVIAFCHAQPAPSSVQSAKEQRQSSPSKARPDRSQAEAKRMEGAQKEAKELQGRKMDAANRDLTLGIASGTGKIGATSSVPKVEKQRVHKDAVNKDSIRIVK
jgi:uncharacterized protein involved in copper resistance